MFRVQNQVCPPSSWLGPCWRRRCWMLALASGKSTARAIRSVVTTFATSSIALSGGHSPRSRQDKRNNGVLEQHRREETLMLMRAVHRCMGSYVGSGALLIAILFGVLNPDPVRAQDGLTTEPILRLAIDRHTAPTARITTDAQNRYVVTASEDKTARVWSLPDGNLI